MPNESDIRGFVSIVGAGPGPADLMTQRALDRLQRADVVVYDRLISPEVLALIPQGAQRVFAGKALGNHAIPRGNPRPAGAARQGGPASGAAQGWRSLCVRTWR